MSVEVLYDKKNKVACLFCNTSDTAFGSIIRIEPYLAYDFLDWLWEYYGDPRLLSEPINNYYCRFLKEQYPNIYKFHYL